MTIVSSAKDCCELNHKALRTEHGTRVDLLKISYYFPLLSPYNEQGTLNAFSVSLKINLQGRYSYVHFTDEKTKVQKC